MSEELRKFAFDSGAGHGIMDESRCSAVGSALRSGRRGRVFESRHLDQLRQFQKGLSHLHVQQTTQRETLHTAYIRVYGE